MARRPGGSVGPAGPVVLVKHISKLEIFTNSSLSDLVQRSWFGENQILLFKSNELDVMQQFVEVHEVF